MHVAQSGYGVENQEDDANDDRDLTQRRSRRRTKDAKEETNDQTGE